MTLWILIFVAWYFLGLVSIGFGEWYDYIITEQKSYILSLADLTKFAVLAFAGPVATFMLLIYIVSTVRDFPYFRKFREFVIFKHERKN